MRTEEALEQIKFLKQLTIKTRLKAAYGYPYFIVWGVLNIIGYLGIYWISRNIMWTVVNSTGITLSIILGIRQIKKHGYTQLLKRIGLQCLILLVADILIFVLLCTHKVYNLLDAYWPFQFGLLYLIASIHMTHDLTLIGLWMIITSILSFLIPIQFQNIWFAITYGGGLLFTGIMFRYQLKKANGN